MTKNLLRSVGFLAIALACVVGCKKDEGFRKATGVVTLAGQPLADAAVTFYSETPDGDGGSGITDASGAFAITSGNSREAEAGVKPGSYKVTVVKNAKVEDPDQDAFDAGEITYDELQERKNKRGNAPSRGGESLVPIQYARINQTPLTATVTENSKENVFNFDLEAD